MAEKIDVFVRQKTWQEAVDETEEGLIPVAMRLKLITDEIDYIPDPSYSEEFKVTMGKLPVVAIACTTVFKEPEYNGKWGYAYLPEETRQNLAKFVHKEVGEETWVFFSQRWKNEG